MAQRLQRHGTQQGRRAAARLPRDQQVGLGGADAGAPHDGRHVPLLLARHHRQRALNAGPVREAEHGLTGRGHEGLGGDVRGQRVEHVHRQVVALLVPREVVLAAPAELGVQQLLDPGPRCRLPVREVRGVADVDPVDPAVAVEVERLEGLLPVAPVRVQRARVVGYGEVRYKRLVEGREALYLRIVGAGLLRRLRIAPLPSGRRHQGDERQQRTVWNEHHDQDDGGHQEEQRSAPLLGGVRPLLPPGTGQAAQPTADRDEGVEYVCGTVGGRPSHVPAPGDRGAAVAQNAGEWAPGHVVLLKVCAGEWSVRT